jgi:hypothetical protein
MDTENTDFHNNKLTGHQMENGTAKERVQKKESVMII